ncbi:hypothetical protein HZR23_09645 [Serpentinicella alkaliphila]|nr:hypothetical protein HZR23_09645 [Serpentinicella alkaliphila]
MRHIKGGLVTKSKYSKEQKLL